MAKPRCDGNKWEQACSLSKSLLQRDERLEVVFSCTSCPFRSPYGSFIGCFDYVDPLYFVECSPNRRAGGSTDRPTSEGTGSPVFGFGCGRRAWLRRARAAEREGAVRKGLWCARPAQQTSDRLNHKFQVGFLHQAV